jgi:hypothetical protein
MHTRIHHDKNCTHKSTVMMEYHQNAPTKPRFLTKKKTHFSSPLLTAAHHDDNTSRCHTDDDDDTSHLDTAFTNHSSHGIHG